MQSTAAPARQTLEHDPLRVLVAISAHGLGHLTQTVAVLRALQELRDDIRLLVVSPIDQAILGKLCASLPRSEPISAPVPDFSPLMCNAFSVSLEATRENCLRLVRERHQMIDDLAAFIEAGRVDAVLSNISPFPLAAAQRLGKRNVALCSLDWAGVLSHIDALKPACSSAIGFAKATYLASDLYIRPEPHIDMAPAANHRSVGPIARIGVDRGSDIRRQSGHSGADRLVLVSSGGIDAFDRAIQIPQVEGILWMLPESLFTCGPDRLSIRDLEARWPFIDLVTSADAIVTKPGYSLVVEAVASGVPVALLDRQDWVDVPSITHWAKRNGRVVSLTRGDIETGRWVARTKGLAASSRTLRLAPRGAWEAAILLGEFLFS